MGTMKDRFSFALVLVVTLCSCGGSPSPTPPPANDFAIQVTPQSVFVPIGFSSATYQVSIVSVNGSSQPVSVSVNGLPQGVTITPGAPFTVKAGSSQAVVFSAAPNVLPAVQQVSFVATSGSLTHTATTPVSVAHPVYAFVLRATVYINLPLLNTQDIYGFAVDANTGAITSTASPITGFYETPYSVLSATLPGGTFLFVGSSANPYSNHLTTFKVDPATGSLAQVSITDFGNTGASVLAVHPSGKFLYTTRADYTKNQFCIVAFLIDPQTANLTESSCTGELSTSFVVPPPGNFAYVTNAQDGLLKGYAVDQNDGSLTLLQNIPSGQMQSVFASDAKGRALYNLFASANPGCSDLGIWTIDSASGSLTPVTTSFGPVQCGGLSITFTLADTFAYVTSLPYQTPNGTVAGAVDAITGNLTNLPGSPFSTAWSAQVEPSQGKYLVGLINNGAGSYLIDPASGIPAQTPASTAAFTGTNNSPIGSGPGFIVVVANK
jgi:6-phosphogluconolactonase (cycloisomerase 2 family)